MTTILPSYLSQYLNLAGNSTDGSASSSDTSIADLAQALTQGSTSAASNTGNGSIGDLLDLSPEAQQYLASLGQSTTTGSSSSSSSDTGFTLTQKQKEEINSILAKYKDAPYTQDTFDQIQHDLEAAGLSPEQLGLAQQVHSFNPVEQLMSALNGTAAPLDTNDPTGNDATIKQNQTAYMQSIAAQWRAISTTATDDTDA